MNAVNHTVDEELEDEVDPLAPVPLTDWVKEPTLSDLKADLEASVPSHNAMVGKVKHWLDLLKAEKKGDSKKDNRSKVRPKIIRRQAEWRYSALTEPLLSSENLFDVKPVTYEDQKGSVQNALVLNHQFRNKLNKVRFIDSYIRTNVNEGSAIIRLGWNRVVKQVPKDVPVWLYVEPYSQEQIDALDQAMALKQANPREYDEYVPEELKAAVEYTEETQVPCLAILQGYETQMEDVIIDNRPTIMIMDQENVFIDPSCGDSIEDARFVVVSFETSKSDLMKQPNIYKNLDRVNWNTADLVSDTQHASRTPNDFNFKDVLRKRVVAYEYWGYADIHGTGELVPIVATWIGSTIVRLQENPFPDGKPPFVVTNYMPLVHELRGETDAELLEDNQEIIGAMMRGVIDLMGRSANAQQGFAKSMLDPVNMKRFREGRDYEFNPNVDPRMGHIQHTYPEIPNSVLQILGIQNQEAEALTGVKSFAGGLSGEAYGDVAAGIRGVLDAASKREMAILRRMAHGLEEIGRKIISMNQVFLSEEEVVRITNEEFITVKREDLAGEYDLIVDISTPEIDQKKSQDLAFMLQTMGPNMDLSITKMILSEICRLQRMPVLAKAIETYEPTPDPIMEEMKKLELDKLRMEVEDLRAKTMLNKAKAAKEAAEAAALDLDSENDATGVKHARAMEATSAQAEANQNLEITKALTKSRKQGEQGPNVEAAVGWNELSRMKSGNPDNLTMISRNRAAQDDPRLSIHSQYYQPGLDPANPVNRL